MSNLSPKPIIFYLHGFASSPKSSKANAFKDRLAHIGYDLHIPDLNQPNFEQLTLSAMIQHVSDIIAGYPENQPIYLIGSSMGGAVTIHLLDRVEAAITHRVKKAVLLAPAIDFEANRIAQLGKGGIDQWRESGWLTVHHYGYDAERRLHFGLMDGLAQYDGYRVSIDLPMLVIHGKQDESVNYQQSVQFADPRPNVDLHLIDADHSLMGVLPEIWDLMKLFLDL